MNRPSYIPKYAWDARREAEHEEKMQAWEDLEARSWGLSRSAEEELSSKEHQREVENERGSEEWLERAER